MRIQKCGQPSIFFSALILLFGLLAAKPVFSAQDPIQMLKNVTDAVMNELRTHRQEVRRHPNKIYALVNHLILPYVDFTEMGRWVVGRNVWKQANNTTQQAFVSEFRTLVVRGYASSLLNYTDQKIEFLPLKKSPEGQQRIQISSLIKGGGRGPVRMDYRLIQEGGTWKVYDIIVEGVSLMQGYRAQFASDAKQGGLTAVVSRIRQHNEGGKNKRD